MAGRCKQIARIKPPRQALLETILNSGEHDDVSYDYDMVEVEEQQVEPKTTPDEAEDSISNVVLDVVADNGKQQVENSLVATLKLPEEAFEQLFCAASLKAHGVDLAMVYDAVEHVILDATQMVRRGETIDKHLDKYFEANKATEVLQKGCSEMTTSFPDPLVCSNNGDGLNH